MKTIRPQHAVAFMAVMLAAVSFMAAPGYASIQFFNISANSSNPVTFRSSATVLLSPQDDEQHKIVASQSHQLHQLLLLLYLAWDTSYRCHCRWWW